MKPEPTVMKMPDSKAGGPKPLTALQRRWYPLEAQRDPVRQFLELVYAQLKPAMVVLDIGAGAGLRNQYGIKGRVREMLGTDFDPRVQSNPLLDRGVPMTGTRLPFQDSSIDLAFSIYVQEHVEDPAGFVQEVHRILKPGGKYLSLTPNRYHYVPLIASLTPTSFHKKMNRKRGRSEDDTFPTFYRLNSRGALKRSFLRQGFGLEELYTVEVQPNYLLFHPAAFMMGVLYERLVNCTPLLSDLRVNVISGFRKPREEDSVQPP